MAVRDWILGAGVAAVLAMLIRLESRLDGLQRDVSSLQRDVSNLTVGQSSLQRDVSSLQRDVSSLQRDVSKLTAGQFLPDDADMVHSRLSRSKILVAGVFEHLDTSATVTWRGTGFAVEIRNQVRRARSHPNAYTSVWRGQLVRVPRVTLTHNAFARALFCPPGPPLRRFSSSRPPTWCRTPP